MSLINDALKRARQAQQQRPPSAADPQLQPMEPAARPVSNPGLLVPMTLVLLVLLAGLGTFFLWHGWRTHSSEQQVVLPTEPPVPVSSAPTPVVQSPDAAVVAPEIIQPSAAVSPTPVSETISASPPPSPSTAQEAVVAAPPKPAIPTLQGIFYRPARPAAIVNGRTVFIGDRVGEFRVQAISQTRVTLASPDQTNVLSLPE